VAGSPKTVNVTFVVETPPTLTASPTTLNFTATAGGANPVAQNVAVGNIAGANAALDWNVGTISYGPGATGWLSCTPASGTNQAAGTSTNVNCQPTTGSLTPGTYTASFNVTSTTSGVAGSPKTVNISFAVQTPPTLTTTPTSLSFTATVGGSNPAAQNITIGNIAGANGPLDWNVGTVTYGPGATGWLNCTPASGTGLAAGTTTNVSCQPTTGALAAGTYTASFDITSATPLVAGSPKTVNVSFTVQTPPTLTVMPTTLNYTATAGGANPAAQNITVGNIVGANGPLDWNVGTISYGPGATGWLSCTPTSGTGLAAGTSTNVSCQPTTGPLTPGTYTASFDITSATPLVAGSPKTVNVTFVLNPPPTLTVTPTSLNYTATAGGANPVAQNVVVGNITGANAALDWNIGTISYGPGATGWLNCTPTNGTGQAAGTSTNVNCQPTTGALAAGTYTASFNVTSSTPGVAGSPKTVNISFTVAQGPVLTVTPTSLNFVAQAGSTNPAAQNITIGNLAGANGPLDWNIGTISYGPGATGWLSCTPTSGTNQAAGTSTPVSCQPTTGALSAGTYTASFDVTSSTPGATGSPKTVNLTFTISAAPPPPATPGYGSSPAPGSTWLLGKSKVGQPVNANLAISETGGATLTVSNPVLGGTNAAEFNITNAASFPLSIPDGGPAQNLVVQCKPSALGTRTATLTLTTNDPTQPTVSYNLQCNGVKEERNPTPADLVGQLRLTPDRLANLDPSTLITVSFKLTNLGPGRADSVRLTFPLDPNLVVGYTSFSDNRMWVSELVTEGEKPYLRVGLPAVEAKQSFSGQIVFRPSAGAADKAKVMLRYVLGWDDEEAAGKQSVSNGVHFRLSREASRNESDGEVQPFEPGELTIVAGTSSLKLSADFYASNEIVTLWYTDASGQSFSLGQQSADREGKLNFEVATASLSVGQTYTIVGYGNRSGISGTSAVTITTP
jgi:methionine-rich copper-binding protein CopC